MNEREKLARRLCKYFKIDPDQETEGIGKRMPEGQKYKLWEWQAINVIDVILPNLPNLNRARSSVVRTRRS